jgi:hypothetical protein
MNKAKWTIIGALIGSIALQFLAVILPTAWTTPASFIMTFVCAALVLAGILLKSKLTYLISLLSLVIAVVLNIPPFLYLCWRIEIATTAFCIQSAIIFLLVATLLLLGSCNVFKRI